MRCFLLAKSQGPFLEHFARLQIEDHADNDFRAGFFFFFSLGINDLAIKLSQSSAFECNLFQGCVKLVSRSIIFLLLLTCLVKNKEDKSAKCH